MRYLVLACVFSSLASAAFASSDEALLAAASAFVDEEVGEAAPERKEAITACILSAFEGIPQTVVATILAQDDFEDGLDVLIEAYPEREQIIESCEEI